MIKQCLRCEKDFYTYPARIRSGKGKYCSGKCYWTAPERLAKCRENMLGKNNPSFGLKGSLNKQFKDKSPHWKGEYVSYNVLHKWINRNKPYNDICEDCEEPNQGKRRLEAANISKEYKRDINDYKWLCPSCHKRFDLTAKTRERLWKANQKRWHPELFI